jgi:multidrug efflux system membrane fusion protein
MIRTIVSATLATLLLASLPPLAAAADAVRGVTRPRDIAQLGPLSEGPVREVPVAEGDRVRAGQVLLRLDDQVQEARIALARTAAEAEGELRQAQAQAAEAGAHAARTAAAARAGGAMEWELRQANARVAVARATVEAAEDRRRLERRRLEMEQAQAETYLVRAPFDGVVWKLETNRGALLARGDRPVTVADLAVLEAVIFVPAEEFAALRPGARYPVRVLLPQAIARTAKLRHVDMLMDSASGRFRCVFTLENADAAIPAGVEVEVTLAPLPGEG